MLSQLCFLDWEGQSMVRLKDKIAPIRGTVMSFRQTSALWFAEEGEAVVDVKFEYGSG